MARGGSGSATTSFSSDLLTGRAMAIHVQNDDTTNNLLVHVETEIGGDSIHDVSDTSSQAVLKPGAERVFATSRGNPIVVLQVASNTSTAEYSWTVVEV